LGLYCQAGRRMGSTSSHAGRTTAAID
jgi:hypothetical protein